MRLGILVMAYNAEKTIGSVLTRIPLETYELAHGIYVFDDASEDETQHVAENVQQSHSFGKKIRVFKHPHNLGYGGNQKYAYHFAEKNGLDVVVMLHGDGQYAPELLPKIYGPLLNGEADLVFGSRIMENPLKGKMPLHKFVGNKLLTKIQNILVGTRFSEFHSGYRAFRTACFSHIPLQNCTNGFHFDTQILILFHDRGFRIKETPIPTFYGNEISHVHIFSYGWNVLKEAASYRIHKKIGKKDTYLCSSQNRQSI
ncbi:MAG: glycosyltransferase family 2 protein [Candidatus Diapherotrites archaeon]